jgi:hypothetical protein
VIRSDTKGRIRRRNGCLDDTGGVDAPVLRKRATTKLTPKYRQLLPLGSSSFLSANIAGFRMLLWSRHSSQAGPPPASGRFSPSRRGRGFFGSGLTRAPGPPTESQGLAKPKYVMAAITA